MRSLTTIKIAAGITLILLLLIGASAFTLIAENRVLIARQWVFHTFDVLGRLPTIRSGVRSAESGQRGYLLTGDEKYLAPFTDGESTVGKAISGVAELTKDNPSQQQLIGSLRTKVEEKFNEMRETIAAASAGNHDRAVSIVKTNSGKKTMEAISEIIRKMMDEERRLLALHLDDLNKVSWQTAMATLSVIVTAIAGMLSLSFYVWHLFGMQKKTEAALLSREARTRALLETAPDAIITFGADGLIESANNASTSIFACPCAEMIGCHISKFIPGLVLAVDNGAQLEAMLVGQSRVLEAGRELVALSREGESIPIEVAWSVLNLSDRSMSTAIVRDISERKAVENKLAFQSAVAEALNVVASVEELTHRFLEISGQFLGWSSGAVWMVDSATNTLKSTDFWCLPKFSDSSFLSQSKNMIYTPGLGLPGQVWQNGQPCWIEDISTDANSPRAKLAFEAGLHTGCAFPIASDGKVIGVCEFFAEQTLASDDRLLQTMSAVGNHLGQVLVRMETEEKIKQSEGRFRQMADNIKEIYWITDQRGAYPIYVSPAYEQIYGRTIKSLFENPHEFFAATHEEDRGRLAETIRRQRTVDYSCEIEYRIKRPDGEVRWLWARLCSIVDNQGKITGLCGVTNDVTDRKEAELRVSEFYSVVSHELRTPLTSIRASLGLIEGGKAGELSAKAMQFIKIGRAETDRLIRLINDILDIKKIEAGKLELEKTSVDPRKLVSKTLDAIGGMAKEAGITLTSNVTTRNQINCDFERLMQVLTNLLSNALKFSPKGSEVSVTVEARNNETLRFAVVDRGPGIPAAQLHKLFNMFQQLDSSDARRKGGTGLGLAISKSIVEEHGGAIGVDSHEGQGSTFWFDLPFESTKTNDSLPGGVKVLVVESDVYWTQVLHHVFSEGTFQTDYVDGVSQAQKHLAQSRPDIIVLDLQSTDGEGIDFLERLKQDSVTSSIPVVILSANDRENGLLGQAYLIDWIKKPFEPVQIKKAVASALRQRHSGPVTVLIVEDDPATREVLRQQIGDLGVNCLEAVDGLQAIDIARNESLDLIILDVGLPLLNGFEVVKVLREGTGKHIPLIVYTNSDLTKDDKRNLSLGFTSHLVKSRTSEVELIASVRDLLNGLLEHKIKSA